MTLRTAAGFLTLATVLILGVCDLVLWLSGEPTISQFVWEWSSVSAAVVFGAGLVCGHWFFPASKPGAT